MKTFKVTYVLMMEEFVEAEDEYEARQQISESFSSGDEMLQMGKWTVTAAE